MAGLPNYFCQGQWVVYYNVPVHSRVNYLHQPGGEVDARKSNTAMAWTLVICCACSLYSDQIEAPQLEETTPIIAFVPIPRHQTKQLLHQHPRQSMPQPTAQGSYQVAVLLRSEHDGCWGHRLGQPLRAMSTPEQPGTASVVSQRQRCWQRWKWHQRVCTQPKYLPEWCLRESHCELQVYLQ